MQSLFTGKTLSFVFVHGYDSYLAIGNEKKGTLSGQTASFVQFVISEFLLHQTKSWPFSSEFEMKPNFAF
jgi:hypothetical protein